MAARDNRYYVYALIDPRDDSTFYIGKGSGSRKSQHTATVRAGAQGCNGAKCERIAAILAEGLEPIETVLSDGLNEIEAYRIERELIKSTDGLTNIVSGTVTAREADAAQARLLLSRLKTYREWLGSATSEQYCVVLRASGGNPREFFAEERRILTELAEAA